MLGVLRFILALMVVVAHLAEGVQFVSHWGVFAVFGFYLLSGYLMTLILHETYAFSFAPFILNRFLRLFPIYYAVTLLTILVLLLFPDAGQFHTAWRFQGRFIDIIGNAFVIPMAFYDAPFRLVPPAWSVAVELTNYLLLLIVVARSRTAAIGAVVAALAYHGYTLAADMAWGSRYTPYYAALLPFALGACVYLFRGYVNGLPAKVTRRVLLLAIAVWVLNIAGGGLAGGLAGHNFELFFYVNVILLYAIVASAAAPGSRSFWPRAGRLLGDLAYPVFLVHWLIGFLVSELFFDGLNRGGGLLLAALGPIVAISFCLAWCANRWLEPLRDRVRGRAAGRERELPAAAGPH